MRRERPLKVIETAYFRSQLKVLIPDLKRWDEIKQTFDLDVALDPDAFDPVPDTPLRAVGLNTTPPRTVYFRVDEEAEAIELVGIL